jgi:outer membrane protein assembly factor BamA
MSRIIYTFIIFFLISGQIFAQADSTVMDYAQPDSVEFYRNQYKGKETWEHMVSFPGAVVSLPLVLFSKMQEYFIGYVYENKLIPKTMDFFTSEDGNRGVQPSYSSRSGGGIKFYQKGFFNPESKLNLKASGSLKGRQHYQIELKRIRFYQRILEFHFMSEYRFLLGEAFYGIGPNTRHGDRTDYNHELIMAESGLGVHFNNQLKFEVQAGLERHNIFGHDGSNRPSIKQLYNFDNLPGLETGVQIARFHAGFYYDSRNRPGNPSSGKEASLSTNMFRDLSDKLYDFWQVSAEVKQYVHLFKNRVLVLRIAGETAESFENRKIPFYYLGSFGRHETIRGFDRGRFRDKDLMLASVEYRIPLWHSIDTELFVDAGQVSNNIYQNFRAENFQFGYGIGWRLWNSKDLIATLEFALSSERFRIYFELN